MMIIIKCMIIYEIKKVNNGLYYTYYHLFDNGNHYQYIKTEVRAIKNKIKVLSGAQLKYIAFLSMLIDHTNKALIYPNFNCAPDNTLILFFMALTSVFIY